MVCGCACVHMFYLILMLPVPTAMEFIYMVLDMKDICLVSILAVRANPGITI